MTERIETERIETELVEPDPDATGAGVTLGAGCCEAHPAAIAHPAIASPSHRHILIRALPCGPRRIFGNFGDDYRRQLGA
jgi:hypothetical protein